LSKIEEILLAKKKNFLEKVLIHSPKISKAPRIKHPRKNLPISQSSSLDLPKNFLGLTCIEGRRQSDSEVREKKFDFLY